MDKRKPFVWNVIEYRKLIERIEKLEKEVFKTKKDTSIEKPKKRGRPKKS